MNVNATVLRISFSPISASYATGRVTGSTHVGGLVGVADPNSSDTARTGTSYAIGWVTGNEFVGGLVGKSEASVVASYADTRTSGQPGRTTADLQTPTGYEGI